VYLYFLSKTPTQPYYHQKRAVESGQWLLEEIQDITTWPLRFAGGDISLP